MNPAKCHVHSLQCDDDIISVLGKGLTQLHVRENIFKSHFQIQNSQMLHLINKCVCIIDCKKYWTHYSLTLPEAIWEVEVAPEASCSNDITCEPFDSCLTYYSTLNSHCFFNCLSEHATQYCIFSISPF